SEHTAWSVKPHGIIERSAGVDNIGDDHGVKWNCEPVVAGNDWLSNKGHLTGILIDNGNDRDGRFDSRQDGNLGQVRLPTKHEILEVLLSCRLKDACAIG